MSEWVRRRQQLMEMQVAEKNRLAPCHSAVEADLKADIEPLNQGIEALNEHNDRVFLISAVT